MAPLPLRENPRPLPRGLKPRHLPEVDFEALRIRSPNFRLMLEALQPVVPGPKKPKIVSTAHGPISKILFTYPAYAAGDYSYREVYADLFKKLPAHTAIVVLHHGSAEAELTSALEQAGVTDRTTTIVAPEHLHFLVWAEDPYVVVQDAMNAEATYFLEPYTFPRAQRRRHLRLRDRGRRAAELPVAAVLPGRERAHRRRLLLHRRRLSGEHAAAHRAERPHPRARPVSARRSSSASST